MKRKVDWEEEEESGKEDDSTSDEESDDEEPRIKDVLRSLSSAVSNKKPLIYYTVWLLRRISCFGNLVDYYSTSNV